jgi:hypothetical protein
MAIGNRIFRRTRRFVFFPAVAMLIVVSVSGPDQINYHNEGQIDARTDLKNHKLIIKLTGMTLQEESIYKETLKRDYGIELDRVAGCIVDARLADYVDGYDEVMAEAIEKLFGQGVFGEELWIAPRYQTTSYVKDQMSPTER